MTFPIASRRADAEIVPAWVNVSVATVWYRPSSPRPIDAPTLRVPAHVEDWLDALSVAERVGLDSRINTQVLLGEKVLVLKQRADWSKIEVPEQRGSKYPDGITGWVPTRQLSSMGPTKGTWNAIVSRPRVWLYSVVDSMVGRPRFLISYDTVLPVVGAVGKYLLVALPGGAEGAVASIALDRVRDDISGSAIVTAAKQFLGLPYLWGGTSGFGYDCSGLVYALFAHYGVDLPRDAANQQRVGTPVALDRIQPGDLLFFATGRKGPAFHVVIYAGAGRVIDSPYTGASVELIPMRSLPVWSDFSGAIRVIGSAYR